MSAVRRIAAIVFLAATLSAAAVVDGRVEREARETDAGIPMPTAASADARSSAFYCAGATATDGGAANGTLVVANGGDRPLQGSVTVVPAGGTPVERAIEVGAAARLEVVLRDLVNAPYAAALVVLEGGQAVVEVAAAGPLGSSVVPCASTASASWHFAEGVTTRDATEVLTLFNPFADAALVDLSFMTEEGQVTPESLTGLTVAGRSLTAVDLGAHVQRREQVATTVRARTGRLVVARLQSFDGSGRAKGASLALGTPSPGTRWIFPDLLVGDGVTERIQLYNPGPAEVSVELHLSLDRGQAEPILLAVPRESRLTVVANDEARIPKDTAFAVTVIETTGAGIVAERSVERVAPGTGTGTSQSPGARASGRQWMLGAGRADRDWEASVIVYNPGTQVARVDVSLLDGGTPFRVGSLQGLEVEPGERRAIALNDAVRAGAVPLLVSADQPVVVARSLRRTGGAGLTAGMAVPVRPATALR